MCSQRAICHHSRQFACANDLWCGQAATGAYRRPPQLDQPRRGAPAHCRRRLSLRTTAERPPIWLTVCIRHPQWLQRLPLAARANSRPALASKRPAPRFRLFHRAFDRRRRASVSQLGTSDLRDLTRRKIQLCHGLLAVPMRPLELLDQNCRSEVFRLLRCSCPRAEASGAVAL